MHTELLLLRVSSRLVPQLLPRREGIDSLSVRCQTSTGNGVTVRDYSAGLFGVLLDLSAHGLAGRLSVAEGMEGVACVTRRGHAFASRLWLLSQMCL